MYIIIGILVGLTLLVAYFYNKFVVGKNRVESAFADIDAQLKRRHNLIPNLIQVVQGYATHEKTTFEELTAQRTAAIAAQGVKDNEAQETLISASLKSVFAVAEDYPDLKANKNFLDLQSELAETEETISMARRYYNGTVKQFNTMIQMFPANIFAGVFGFKKRDFFQAKLSERKNIKL